MDISLEWNTAVPICLALSDISHVRQKLLIIWLGMSDMVHTHCNRCASQQRLDRRSNSN